MFGNCPRVLWQRWAVPDEENRIELACRSLLVRENGGRNILFEAGVGMALEPRLRARYGIQDDHHRLVTSLGALGIPPEGIDVVVVSHLHFDHAGGLLSGAAGDRTTRLVFSRAAIVVSRAAWERARQPHARDRASFLPGLCDRLASTGRLVLVADGAPQIPTLGDSYELLHSHGHTPGLLMTRVPTSRGPLFFVGDCIPGVPWIHLPITTGFDCHPELLVEEKRAVLTRVQRENGWVFFTHDAGVAACRVSVDREGRVVATDRVAQVKW